MYNVDSRAGDTFLMSKLTLAYLQLSLTCDPIRWVLSFHSRHSVRWEATRCLQVMIVSCVKIWVLIEKGSDCRSKGQNRVFYISALWRMGIHKGVESDVTWLKLYQPSTLSISASQDPVAHCGTLSTNFRDASLDFSSIFTHGEL